MNKGLVLYAVLSCFVFSEAQAGFWDWIPGKKRGRYSCNYTDNERRALLPSEREKAFKNTPPSYPVEKFNIKTVFAEKPWLRGFRYLIVINKAAAGTTAQSIRVYEDGYKILADHVSTGREKLELRRKYSGCEKQPPQSYYSITATGYYPIQKLSKDHHSESFDADMPFSMFYDRVNGLALHQVMDAYTKRLGSRASGGCTRLRRDMAQNLFERIEKTKGADIPMVRPNGNPVLDSEGRVRKTRTNKVYDSRYPAFSALVIIEEIHD